MEDRIGFGVDTAAASHNGAPSLHPSWRGRGCPEHRRGAVVSERYGRGIEVNRCEAKTKLSQLVESAMLGADVIMAKASSTKEALAELARFFLEVCLDQVAFMEGLTQPDRLRVRILPWAEEKIRLSRLPARAGAVLEAILFQGELPRRETAALVGASERSARRIVSASVDGGVLTSESSRAPLKLAFPAALAGRWIPGLFPEITAG